MINVSNEFKNLMNTRTDFKENAEITFSDGTVLALTEKDFTVSNNGVTDAAETNGIPLGVALCRPVQIELMNDDDRFSEYDFYGAKIQLFLTFQLSETVEKIEYGTFTVLTPETYGETVIITALDDMYKADKPYETTLVYPATLGAIWADACNGADIQPGTTTFLNDDFVVESKPTDITYRQLFGFIAMIAGGNARIDTTGRLRIITYDFEKLDGIYNAIIDGGRYSPWSNSNSFDGGAFSPWNEGDVLDGGAFSDRADFHVLGNWSNLKVDTDDVVITGVKASYTNEDNEEMSAMYGTEGYVLQIENPLISGKEEDAVTLIGTVMVGAKFRQFSGDMVANPTCEFMDPAVVVDRKGNCYISFLTDINFQFFGFTTLKNSAEPALRNSSKAYSEATKTLVAARKLVKNERTARERAVAQLAKELANSSGLFVTEEKQEDGSSIWYMHDKSSLSESMIVWKLTSLAFGVSTDGGKTYPYGFTVDGETITRLLYAEGIDADYINAGAIKISDTSGNTLFLADYDTKQVYVNAENVYVGSKKIAAYVENAITSATEEIRLEVTERTSLYNEEVNSLQGGMDGNIDLSFFDCSDDTIVTTMANKQCVFGENISQDVSLPAGTYLFSYEWLRTLGTYRNADVYLYDLSTYPASEIYVKNLGYAWPDENVWHKESFQFTLKKTTRVSFSFLFSPPWDYPDRVNDLYLTNIALYGTAQSVSDAITDMKTELLLQQDQISAKVEKEGVIGAINLTSEKATISAGKIDLVGLVTATEFTTKFATIDSLNAQTARIDTIAANYISANAVASNYATINSLDAQESRIDAIESNYISADTVKADYMEVANWTSSGYIKASRLKVDDIVAKIGSYENVIFAHNLKVYSRLVVGDAIMTSSVKFRNITVGGTTYSVLCAN